MDTDFSGNIQAWSLRVYENFRRCKYAAKLAHSDRRPPPERGDDHPLNRGIRVHKLAQDYVTGVIDKLPRMLQPNADQFEWLRDAYANNEAVVEEEWAFTANLQPCDWRSNDAWLRVKCDAVIYHDPETITIVDLKTGRKWGNEVKHFRQKSLYAGAALLRNAELTDVRTEFWFPDQGGATSVKHFLTDDLYRHLHNWIERGKAITSETEFRPSPNASNCRYCDYGLTNGTGECPFAVETL